MNIWTFREELASFGTHSANCVSIILSMIFRYSFPPLFSEVRKKLLANEIIEYIDNLNISDEEKQELKSYYGKSLEFGNIGRNSVGTGLAFQLQ